MILRKSNNRNIKNKIKIREELNSVNIKKTEDFLEYGGTKQEQKRFFKKQGFLK